MRYSQSVDCCRPSILRKKKRTDWTFPGQTGPHSISQREAALCNPLFPHSPNIPGYWRIKLCQSMFLKRLLISSSFFLRSWPLESKRTTSRILWVSFLKQKMRKRGTNSLRQCRVSFQWPDDWDCVGIVLGSTIFLYSCLLFQLVSSNRHHRHHKQGPV